MMTNDLIHSALCVGRIEGLQYVAEWIHYHRTIPNPRPGYLAALGDMQTHVDAAIERLRHGEPMRMSSQPITWSSLSLAEYVKADFGPTGETRAN